MASPSLKASLSPLATGEAASEHVIQRSGQAAETVASRLQLLIAEETYPLVLGPWVRGGPPTAVDRQLGLAYGAGAVRALKAGKNGVMVAFVPPDMKFVPLAEAINKVRTVPADSVFMQIAAVARHLSREGRYEHTIRRPARSDRHRPEHPALLQPRRPGHPHQRFPQGLLAALQMVQQSREHPPQAGTGLRPQASASARSSAASV